MKEYVICFKDGELLFVKGYDIDRVNDDKFIIIKDTFINKDSIKYIQPND